MGLRGNLRNLCPEMISLANVADGNSLFKACGKEGEHQLGKVLRDSQVASCHHALNGSVGIFLGHQFIARLWARTVGKVSEINSLKETKLIYETI